MRHITHFRWLTAVFICFFLATLLPAQNKDSLVSAYREASLSRNTGKIYKISSSLGTFYMGQNESDSAVYYFNIALKHAATQMEKADAYTGLARSTLFTKPAYSMNTAKKGLTFVKDTACVAKVNLGNAIGIYYSQNGKYDSSIYYYTIALTAAEKMKDEKLINKVKGNLGDVYSYQGDYSTALKYQLEDLAFLERIKDSALIIRMTVNVGNTYSYMNKDSIALRYYMRVYPVVKNQASRLAGNLFNSIALAYEGLGENLKENDPKFVEYTAKQKSFLEQSLEVKTALKDSLGIANTLINLGLLEVKEKNNTGAVKYFYQALEIAKRLDNPRLERAISGDLGDLYMSEKSYDKALQFYQTENTLGERDKDMSARHDALSGIYRAYEGLGDYKSAYEYLFLYKELLMELNNAETAEKMAEAEAKYKNQESQRLNEKLAYDNKLQAIANEKAENDKRLILIFSAAALLLLVFIFFLVFRNVKIKAKAKKEQEITKAVFASEQKERIRISRDLHDNVGTQLSLISNDIEWITHPLKSLTETEKAEKMEFIAGASKEVINTLRETIWALNKEEVSFEEFADKLKAHVQKQVKLSKNVQPSFRENLACTIQLNPSEALGLFRICQEAIANSLKYAQSETLGILLNAQDGKYELVISDNGKGFNRQHTDRQNRYGIANMEFRAREIACKLQIDSSEDTGTSVKITKI
ncbi:MAG: tetratricopeptide repeat protein [Bacteroidota bacterium]|nr:tetratricopeptide repeat protein [Bacteroidota bacterium]